MLARLPISTRRSISALAPAPTPITASRPRIASASGRRGRWARRPARGSRRTGPRSAKPSGAIARTPSAAICSRACSLRTVAVTRAPAITPSWTAAMPTPPAAPWTSRRSPSDQARLGEQRVVGGGEDLGHAAGRGPVELVRAPASRSTRARPRARPGPPPATTAITRSPGSKRPTPRPHVDHLAGQLEARDVRRRARAAPGSGRRAGACRRR